MAMTGREKQFTGLLVVLFCAVGLAAGYQGWRLLSGRANRPALQPAARLPLALEPSKTPWLPIANTPAAGGTAGLETPPPPAGEKIYADDLPLSQALLLGWTTVTVFTPWGETMVFSFQPLAVDFQQVGFALGCPYDQPNACVSTHNGGAYALAHSEYPGAVAEQARRVVEGTLYSLAEIQQNVAALRGAEAEIQLADGRYMHARVTSFTRTTGSANLFNLANNRQAVSNRLIIEFCGLPHFEDGTDAAGATGSVYLLTLSKGA